MIESLQHKRGELIIYAVLWSIILLMPAFISNGDNGLSWVEVSHEWFRIGPYLLIFVIHNFVLFPYLLGKGKRLWYFIASLSLVAVVSFLALHLGEWSMMPRGGDMPLPPADGHPHPFPQGGEMHPPRGVGPGPKGARSIYKSLIDNVIVSFLVIGFNAAIKVTIIWQAEAQKAKELAQEKLKTELAFLRNQVSPHFFMNTLNNIHALIDIDQDDAKESVIKLSRMMRYLLYDSEAGQTTLEKELEFVQSYVDLMKLRFTEQVKIALDLPRVIPPLELPPMLFTSLLENAFKHGISYQYQSFVNIKMEIIEQKLLFSVENSKFEKDNGLNEPGGIGLDNLKKRLSLLYNDDYELEKNETKDTYKIQIKIPLHDQNTLHSH